MKLGVHCSVRHGFAGALKEAASLNCQTMQIFLQSPRGWRSRKFVDIEFQQFKIERRLLGINPVVVHSLYLPNLCTSNVEMYEKSIHWLKSDLEGAALLGAEYLVIHPGAYSPESNAKVGIQNFLRAMNQVLDENKEGPMILIENMAGGGRRLGGKFSELSQMLNGIHKVDRVGICFDTCHAFAAGYDIRTESSVDKVLKEFDQTVGLNHVKIFHVNDSRGALGCQRDLHEHVGLGKIGMKGFEALFKCDAFKNCALILETPKRPIPASDKKNLQKLRTIIPQ